MSEPIRYTGRGFGIYAELKDTYGAGVDVVESSAAEQECVWIFVEGGATRDNNGAAHLTVGMARTVHAALGAWLEGKED